MRASDLDTGEWEEWREWLVWDFVGRQRGVPVETGRDEAVARLVPHYREAVDRMGEEFLEMRTAEQVHGDGIAIVGEVQARDDGVLPNVHAGVDGLMTDRAGLPLGILVADCCAVYVVDPEKRAIALLHSGKKGSELGIVPKAIALMGDRYGSRASDLRIALSPCIRPPLYEIDFAAAIHLQCAEAGVPAAAVRDSGRCTGSDLGRYYSYRVEKGKTGRMLAVLGLRGGAVVPG